jgi:integrase
LIGLYTGTRAAAIAAAAPARAEGRAYVDLEHGVFYRLAIGKRATNKRQPPVPLPQQLLSHMRRWSRIGVADDYFVTWHGEPVRSVKKGFARAVALAGLEDVTPHTLRHTAATWLMQNGTPIWEAAGFLGMSPEILDRVYGHHHPDHLQNAARKIGAKGKSGDSLVISLEEAQKRRVGSQKTL